jgi:phenylalanyl-tRNA synthetase beta chain
VGWQSSHLCEIGRVFIERNGQNLECAAVAFVIAEPMPSANGSIHADAADFYTVKHHVFALAAAGGIDLARQPLVPVTGSVLRLAGRPLVRPPVKSTTAGPPASA